MAKDNLNSDRPRGFPKIFVRHPTVYYNLMGLTSQIEMGTKLTEAVVMILAVRARDFNDGVDLRSIVYDLRLELLTDDIGVVLRLLVPVASRLRGALVQH